MTNDQLGKALVSSGLLPVGEVKSLWAAIPAEQRPKDAKSFAELLIEQGKLTKFQATELLSGTNTPLILGDYQLLAKIGAGGMGQVFKAQHRHMKRTVAIKLLPAELTKDEAAIKRFQREVEAAAKLSHPNIVQAYDASTQRGVWYLVMEYVEGRDLAGIVAAEGSLPITRAVNYIRQSARGLGFAHESGVVHRDIKPANLLLDKKGTIKILDMGLARFDDGAAQEGLTQSGQVMGTVDYMAPEQAFDTRHADARADVYSLGCTLFRLLTAQNMYEGESLVQKLMGHQSKPIPKLTKFRPDVSPQLEAIFERMVAKDPKERYQTMAEVIAALAPFEEGGKADDGSGLTAHFEGIGAGPATNAALLAQQTAAFVVPTSVNPTVSINNPLQSTDPVSARSIQLVRERTPQPGAIKRPPGNRKKLLIAAGGAAAALVVLLGIWVIIKDKDGNEVARVQVPEGGSATIQSPATGLPAKQQTTSKNSAAPQFALQFDGKSSVETPDIPWGGLSEYTVEAWARAEDDGSTDGILVDRYKSASLARWQGRWQLTVKYADEQVPAYAAQPAAKTTGEWEHLAGVVKDGVAHLYVNGKRISSKKLTKPLDFGQGQKLSLGTKLKASLRAVRWSKTARYTSDFTPSEQLASDGDTLLLYKFDEGSGDVLRDSSGNNHHGKIVGAKWVKVDSGIKVVPSSFALDFAADPDAHVDIPAVVQLDKPFALEMVVTPRNNDKQATLLRSVAGHPKFHLIQTGSTWRWQLDLYEKSSGTTSVSSTSKRPSVRHHLLVASTGKELRIFVDGRLAQSDLIGKNINEQSGTLLLGGKEGPRAAFDGTVHALRVSRSARYETDFAPQYRFESDADTLALYNFEEGVGDMLKDTSGNNHHGKIVGAKWVKMDGAKAPTPQPGQSSFALKFGDNPKDPHDNVLLPNLKLDINESFTVEGYVTALSEISRSTVGFFHYGGFRLQNGPQWHLNLVGETNNVLSIGKSPKEGNKAELNQRVHVAVVRAGQDVKLFVNGKFIESKLAPERLKLPADAPERNLGTSLFGLIDQFRVSQTARYDKDFSPPVRFENDKSTLALYYFEEGEGDVLKDSSGNNHHGKIVRAKWVRADGSPITAAPALVAPPLAKAPFTTAQAKAHQEAWAKHLGTDVVKPNSIGMQMTLIPPGQFLMGSSDQDVTLALKIAAETKLDGFGQQRIQDERPQHSVRITKPFRLGMHEVTIGQFRKFIEHSGYKTQAEQFGGNSDATKADDPRVTPESLKINWRTPGQQVSENSPVTQVSWNDAVAFCNWLSQQEKLEPSYVRSGDSWTLVAQPQGYRLPTEAEWEYACRAGTTSQYSFGDGWKEHDKYGWSNTNAGGGPKEVGLLSANPFGLYDMHGNVWEWCHDLYDGQWYARSPADDPKGPLEASYPVNRGGSWTSPPPRSSLRSYSSNQAVRNTDRGFRVVRVLDTPKTTVSAMPQPAPNASGKLWMHDPAFPQWVKDVQALPADKQIEAVNKKLAELNPGYQTDLSIVRTAIDERGVVTEFYMPTNSVTDISPIRAFAGLKLLACGSSTPQPTNMSDLSPLRGMTTIDYVNCRNTSVQDLSPLYGLHNLRYLNTTNTKVTPAELAAFKKVIPTCNIDANNQGRYGSPTASSKLWMHDPAFPQWVKDVQALPADKQLEAVSKKLRELNPGFDGKLTGWRQAQPTIQNGIVKEVGLLAKDASDISPLRAFTGLKSLECFGGDSSLTRVNFSDITPLEGMKLTYLALSSTQVSDLRPLANMPLDRLYIYNTLVSDLTPLRGSSLKHLIASMSKVSDIAPLRGLPLVQLVLNDTLVTDLAPIASTSTLTSLQIKRLKISPTALAELKKSLPNCQIEWEDPAKATTTQPATSSKLWMHDPAFPDWLKRVQALGEDERFEQVQAKLVELNQGFDGQIKKYMLKNVVNSLAMNCDHLHDLSPLRALATLQRLDCPGSLGTPDTLADLSPLKGMRLVQLNIGNSQVSDLSPLQGMPLEDLKIYRTKVKDLSPLKGMPLKVFTAYGHELTDLSPLQTCKQLTSVNVQSHTVTADTVAALQKALPNCKIEWEDPNKSVKAWETPAFQQWIAETKKLPADKQLEAVSKKLMELNPGFDGKVTDYEGSNATKIENGAVTEIGFFADNVSDISPVQALAGLKKFRCNGSNNSTNGKLSDLSPLQGLALTELELGGNNNLTDLSPLRGMPLTRLYLGRCSRVNDLSSLRGLKLSQFICFGSQVSDLSPLSGMPLTYLDIGGAPVSDLSPTKGMPLQVLKCVSTPLSDLSPLAGMNLIDLTFTPRNITKELGAIRQMKSLKFIRIGWRDNEQFSPDEFWKKYDAGVFSKLTAPEKTWETLAFQQWVKETQALPAEEQLKAVSKKLTELNPRFDGTIVGLGNKGAPMIGNGVVTECSLYCDHVTDISPIRALAGLSKFGCVGSKNRAPFSDLSPLQGMKLTVLECYNTQVRDLSALRDMGLTRLLIGNTDISDLSPLESCPKLNYIYARSTRTTATAVANLKEKLPYCTIEWDDPAAATSATADPQRRAAEWVLGKGGSLDLVDRTTVRELKDLPPGSLKISTVRLHGKDLNAEDKKLVLLRSLPDLHFLSVYPATASSEGIAGLEQLAKLERLSWGLMTIDHQAVEALSKLKRLNSLYVSGAKIHTGQLEALAIALPNLSSLNLQGAKLIDGQVSRPLDDQALSALAGFKKMKTLQLQSTKVTAAGVATLQKALPECKIEWDDPAATPPK